MVQNSEIEHVRKRRKVVHSPEIGSVGKTLAGYKDGTFGSSSSSQGYNFESEGRKKLRDAQKSLHLSLKPEIAKLCKILKFSDNAQCIAEEFLEYVMNNHDFRTESTTILQALQISLCRTVASMLKQKIDHREFLALAKQHLNFNCSKDEADFAYSIFRCLKGTLSYRTGKLEVADSPRVPVLSVSNSLKDYMHGTHSPSSNDQRFLSQSELALEIKVAQDNVSKSIKRIQKKFQKKLNKLKQKQQEDKIGLVRSFEADKARIEERKKMETVVVRSCLENGSMREDKLKLVDVSFAKEFEELEYQMDARLKKLEGEHLAARGKIQDREARWVDAVKSWVDCDLLLGKRPSSEPDDNAGEVALRFPHTNSSNDGANNIAHVDLNPSSSKEQICNGLTVNESEKEVQLGVPETIGSSDGQENLDLGYGPLSEEQIPVTTAVSSPINEMQLKVPENVSSSDGDTAGSVTQVSLAEQIVDTATLNVPSGENTLSAPEISCVEVEFSQISDEGNETRTVAPNIATGLNQQNVVDNAVDANSPLEELSQVNSTSVQHAIAMTDGDATSANQVHEDGRTLSSGSCGMQLGDIPPSDEQNATEVEHSGSPPVETASSNQSNLEAMVSEPAAQVHLSQSSNSSSSCNTANVPIIREVVNLPRSEGCTFDPATELVVNPPRMLNQPVSQPSTSSLNQPFDIPIGALGMHFPELRTSVASDFNNCPAQTMPAVPLVPPPEYDVLRKELERLCKEFDQTCKGFEDKKLHLKAECDKEIAQIFLKYEIKQQEVDSEVLTKRKEFHDNRNKVWMNKFLADAFRFTYMERRTSGRSGTQQDVNASYMQQIIELSLQQNAQRPSLVASTSTASTPAARLQTLAHEPQTTISAPIISPHSTPSPPVQYVSPPSALFPSAIARPAQISSVSASGNLQGGPQIRARAPHLQSSPPTTSRPPLPHRMSTPAPANTPTQLSNTLPCFGRPQIRYGAPHLRSSAPTTSLPPHPHRMSTLPPTNAPTLLSNTLPCFGGPLVRAEAPHPGSSASTTSLPHPYTMSPPMNSPTVLSNMLPYLAGPLIRVGAPHLQRSAPTISLPPHPHRMPTTPPMNAPTPLSNTLPCFGGPQTRVGAPHLQNLAPTTSLPSHQHRIPTPPPTNAPTLLSNTPPCYDGPQIHAGAPNLRSSAPTTSLPSHPHEMLTSPPRNAPTPLSNLLPCLPPRLASSTSIGPSPGALRPETSRGLPALPNILSALELLKCIDCPRAALPSLVDCLPNTGHLNFCEFDTSNVSVNPNPTSAPTDVECLSDDNEPPCLSG